MSFTTLLSASKLAAHLDDAGCGYYAARMWWILRSFGRGAATVLVARCLARYGGEKETLDPVASHIPGTINRFPGK